MTEAMDVFVVFDKILMSLQQALTTNVNFSLPNVLVVKWVTGRARKEVPVDT